MLCLFCSLSVRLCCKWFASCETVTNYILRSLSVQLQIKYLPVEFCRKNTTKGVTNIAANPADSHERNGTKSVRSNYIRQRRISLQTAEFSVRSTTNLRRLCRLLPSVAGRLEIPVIAATRLLRRHNEDGRRGRSFLLTRAKFQRAHCCAGTRNR